MQALGTDSYPNPKTLPLLFFPKARSQYWHANVFEILNRHTANPLEDAEVSNTTPTRSTYCLQNSSQCLCLGTVGANMMPALNKSCENDGKFLFSTGTFLLKYSQLRQPQSEALMNTRIISVSIWGDLRVEIWLLIHSGVFVN